MCYDKKVRLLIHHPSSFFTNVLRCLLWRSDSFLMDEQSWQPGVESFSQENADVLGCRWQSAKGR